MNVVSGIHEHSTEKALAALREAGDMAIDMKLFARLLLERMRAVILKRNAPSDAEAYLASFSDEDKAVISEIAKDPKTLINSKTLLRFLDATDQVGRTHIAVLPLELAVIDSIPDKKE